ncbi:MAG: protein kinase [Sedimentitalea sp.]
MIDSRPGDAFQPGELLNNTYRIELLLGRGGTSDVYRARNETNGRLMALKVLKSEFSENQDFHVLLTREEEIREVMHDAVVRYSENGRTQHGHLYLLMDYVEGPGMDQRLKQGAMDAGDLMVIARRVSEGLRAAHTRNIVHRDLSPDNIILRDGDPGQAVIIDFGIAKDTNPGAETIVGNEFAGKYAYAAPEQLNGRTDARSDIYALGALLLANFRGAPPDIGNNPMEVVTRKGEPLDTSDVPEPLKTLIDRMADPDPDKRLPSAAAVLAFLDTPTGPGGDLIDMDDTIVPPPPKPASKDPTPVAQPQKSRGGLVAGALAFLVAAGGTGGYVGGAFDSLLGPTHPHVDPFTLVVEKPSGAPGVAIGHVPDSKTYDDLLALALNSLGTVDVSLASGDIAASWGADMLAALNPLPDLDDWRMVINGNAARITGSTSDAQVHSRLAALFKDGPPGALTGTAEIELIPLFLSTTALTPVLEEYADCGALELPGATPVGYGPDTPVTVTGRVAATSTRVRLYDALREIAGERRVVLDVEVLNTTLCLIEANLPKAPSSNISVAFTVGDRNEPNPSGRFFVGENPVIDVILPPEIKDGYLTVSVLDVSGNVFHLLPNRNRQDNSVATLRDGTDGTATVRVAYSVADVAQFGRLGFTVDDSTLGKSKVVVLHSAKPLFSGLRPTTESATGYAEALKESMVRDRTSIKSLDSRILETAQP